MSEPTSEEPRAAPALEDARAAPAPEYDPVDDWGDSSFPASDPPSWWSGPSTA